MKLDFFGRPLPPGCEVLFMLQTGSQPGSKSLWRGTVIRSTEKWVEIEHASPHSHSGQKAITKRLDNLVLVPSKSELVVHHRLVAVCLTLYMAGRWTCEGLTPEEQAKLWEALRDILGLPPGTATELGMGAKP